MKGFQWYVLVLMLALVSLDGLFFKTAVGTFRTVHFFSVFCFLTTFFLRSKKIPVIANNLGGFAIGVIFFIYCLYGPYTLKYSYYPEGTKTIIFGQLFNVFIFLYTYSLLVTDPDFFPRLKNVLLGLIRISCVLVFVQYAGAVVGALPITDPGSGIAGVGRPTLFFDDPNWIAFYLLMNYWLVLWFYKQGEFTKKTMTGCNILIFCAFMIIQSRLALSFFFITYFFHYMPAARRKAYALVVGVPLFVIVLLLGVSDIESILPRNMYYDLVDLSKNPRLNDFTNLITEIDYYKTYKLGFGWGSLPFIYDDYASRGYKGAVNVLPLQIYFDFGYVGLIIFTFLFIISIPKYKDRYLRMVYVMFIVYNVFHLSVYKQFFWVYMVLLIYINRNYYKKIKLVKRNEEPQSLVN